MLTSQAYLGDLIRERVPLGRLSGTGFYEQRCQLCNDHSPRAGWKIEPTEIFYNCYNCHAHASYEEGTGKFSRWMKEICHANGITDQDLQAISATLFFNQAEKSDKEITLESLKKISLHTPEIAFPDRTLQLGAAGYDEFQEPLIEYLLDRQMDPLKFYFSLDPAHHRRVLIPYWRDSKLIFWQSRAIDRDVKPRYRNCSASKDAIIYGYDRLFEYSEDPLFVTEGAFDAESADGICILGSSLNAAKIEVLHKTRRRVIFVIDRDSNGGDLGEQVLREGWELTFVDPRAEDVNDSVRKFGRTYTLYTLIKNATTKANKIQSKLQLDLGLLEAKLRKTKYGS
jgi:hypothetical protein